MSDPPMSDIVFRPDRFFIGAYHGWGVSRDVFGKVRDRYTLSGVGEPLEARRLFSLREDYQFADGRTDRLEWEIGADEEGAFYGRDRITGAEGFGRQVGADYIWSFTRRTPTVYGEMSLALRAHYAVVAPDKVICTTTLKRWGFTLATLDSCYRRIG